LMRAKTAICLFAFVALLVLAGAMFARTDFFYDSKDGIEVKRAIEYESRQKISLITGAVDYDYTTISRLTVKNTNPKPRFKVSVSDQMPSLLGEYKFSYTPAPDMVNGKPIWVTQQLDGSKQVEIIMMIEGRLSDKQLALFERPAVTYEKKLAKLSGIKNAVVGKETRFSINDWQGAPIRQQQVAVLGPAGLKLGLISDDRGEAWFVPQKTGTYFVDLPDFEIEGQRKIEVAGPSVPAISSSTQADKDLQGLLLGYAPYIGLLILASVVLFAAITYFANSRKRPEEQYEAMDGEHGPADNSELVIDEGKLFSAQANASAGLVESASVYEESGLGEGKVDLQKSLQQAETLDAQKLEQSRALVAQRLRKMERQLREQSEPEPVGETEFEGEESASIEQVSPDKSEQGGKLEARESEAELEEDEKAADEPGQGGQREDEDLDGIQAKTDYSDEDEGQEEDQPITYTIIPGASAAKVGKAAQARKLAKVKKADKPEKSSPSKANRKEALKRAIEKLEQLKRRKRK